MTSFWENKPVKINSNTSKSLFQLYTNEKLLYKINTEMLSNKIQLDHSIYTLQDLSDNKLNNIISFLNKNYISSKDDKFKLIYTLDLFKFYCNDSLIIEFTPKYIDIHDRNDSHDRQKIVGYIIAKKKFLNVYNNNHVTVEVNFLCILQQLRKLGIAEYMINILTRESILKYNVGMAHYTISSPIKSPHFSKKNIYHIPINIKNLINSGFLHNDCIKTKNYIETSDKYNYNKTLSIEYIHNSSVISQSKASLLYNKYIDYCKKTYDIYEYIDITSFLKTFDNNDFYHFIVSNNHEIISYICLFKLDTINIQLNNSYKNGYLYNMFFEENIIDSLEITLEYIYKNSIFDIITLSDMFTFYYNRIIPGNGSLKYYLFNAELNSIENHKNGLITI